MCKFISYLILFLLILTFLSKNTSKLKKGGQKILTNNNINDYFEINNKLEKNKDKLVISCAFYYNKNNKKLDFENNKYINGLKSLYEWVKENKYILRIYYDKSVEILINKYFTNKEDIELFKYHFPDFFEIKNNKHIGNFGMYIRFLPIFNIPKHYCKNVYITDIDLINDKDVDNLLTISSKYIKNMKNNDLLISGKYLYSFRKRLNLGNKYGVLGSCIYKNENISIDNKIFFNYFNKYLVNKHTVTPFKHMLIYGSDEYFLNKYIFSDEILNKYKYLKIVYLEKKIVDELLSSVKNYDLIINDIKNTNSINNINNINNIIDRLYLKYKNNCNNKILLKNIIKNNILLKNKYKYILVSNSKETYKK